MSKSLERIFSRTTVKQDLLTYLLPVPIIVYFVLFNFKVGRENSMLFLSLAVAASVITLIIRMLVKYYFMHPMLLSIRKVQNNITDIELFKKAKRNAYKLPLIDGIFIWLSWSFFAVLIVSLPLLVMNKATNMNSWP